MSNRSVKVEGASTGAYPLKDPSGYKQVPPLTLGQKIQKTRSEIITEFVKLEIEPLLEDQALSGVSKTLYQFIPSDTDPEKVAKIIPKDKNIVEGYGGSQIASRYIMSLGYIKGHVKVIRLTSPKYNLTFWKQPTVMEELEETLKLRLEAKGEKLAKTESKASVELYRDSSIQPWYHRTFLKGEKLSAGLTGVEVIFETKGYDNIWYSFVNLYIEIA